jgi:hypothetical protein
MSACIQFVLLYLQLIVSHVLSQHRFKPSITCYRKYEHEETRNEIMNITLRRWYSESLITRRFTKPDELCSSTGCACFSYRRDCSYSSPRLHHFSQCNTTDRQNGIIKWHRGVTTISTCEQMRQLHHIYLNLTCCYADRCNDQPGKIITIVDTNGPSQLHDTNDSQTQEALSSTHMPNRFDSTSLRTNQSLSSNSFSSWTIFFILVMAQFCYFFES